MIKIGWLEYYTSDKYKLIFRDLEHVMFYRWGRDEPMPLWGISQHLAHWRAVIRRVV
jgi:hypothetical protein